MRNNLYKALAIVSYLLSVFIIIYCIKIRFTPHEYIGTNNRLKLVFTSCILIYIGGFISVNKLGLSKKILKFNLLTYILIYTTTIFTLTLFDELLGRNGLVIVKWNNEMLSSYIENSFNIIPFRTIKLFTNGYINGYVSFKNFSINIIGNFCAFMPYGIFLPLMLKKINKYYKFILIMFIMVVIIELLQFVTLSGSCDIDDLILNLLGASIIYFIYKIKYINKIMQKIFLLE